jgi:tetratricopeptide (TPR) repeat protein
VADLARARDPGREALAHAERAAAIAQETETLTTLATALGVHGEHARAIAVLQRLIALQPGLRAAYTNLGVELLALGRLPEAEAALCTALRARPDDALAHNNLANILERSHAAEALKHYAAAVRRRRPKRRARMRQPGSCSSARRSALTRLSSQATALVNSVLLGCNDRLFWLLTKLRNAHTVSSG